MEKGGSLPNCYNFLHIFLKIQKKYMLNCNRYSIISHLEIFFSFGGIFIKNSENGSFLPHKTKRTHLGTFTWCEISHLPPC